MPSSVWRQFICITAAVTPLLLHAQPATAPRVRVVGVVFDSIARTPLSGALVQLAAINDRAHAVSSTTNALGEFSVDAVEPGEYVIGFLHPRLDSLLLAPRLLRIVISGSAPTLVALAIPSTETLAETLCGTAAQQSAATFMVGRLRIASDQQDASAGVVRGEWSELTTSARGLSTRPQSSSARIASGGAFVLCGLPRDVRVYLRAALGADSTPPLTLDVPSEGVVVRDLWIGARASTVRRARGGIVYSPTRVPIRGARLTLRGSTTRVTADANGVFTLPSVALGTRMLDVEAIGFQPQHIMIDVLSDDTPALDITLPPLVATLAAVRVNARSWESAYNARRQKHIATFMDDSTIARRNPLFIADAVRAMSGVRLVHTNEGFSDRIMLGTPRKSCEPTVFIDGVRQRTTTTADIDVLVDPHDVRAIELYRYGFEVPFEFDAPSSCGALMIWRK